jgi:crotonobetainyl-CoA:carnitine CoA-transferase CaiB-like acyl-CoA transferase
MDDANAPLPLNGLRVVELTHMVMGPACGLVLADLGAEVARRLAASADVVVENFKPGTLKKYGLERCTTCSR